MLESELAQYINPVKRNRIFEEVLNFSTLEDFQTWRNGLMPAGLYPEVPEALWHRVPLLVPHGDGFVRVEPNELVVGSTGEDAVPDLIATDYVSMTDEELHIYADYMNRYGSYLEDLIVEIKTRVKEMKQRNKEVRDLLILTYENGPTQSQKKALAATDPFVRELDREIQSDESKVLQLDRRTKKLVERVALVSRELTRRHKQYDLDRATDFGSQTVGPRIQPQPPRGRRTERYRRR